MQRTSPAALAVALLAVTTLLVAPAARVHAADTTAPTAPTELGGFPATQTASDRFTIFWTNPTDESAIAAAHYTLDVPPTSNSDGARVAPVDDPTDPTGGIINDLATGGRSARTLYLWLEDAAGNLDFTATASVILRPEGSLDDLLRVSGSDRFGTAAATSRKVFPDDRSASNVVLANGRGFADALAGVPLAFEYNAPILLTERDTIPQATWDELIRVLAPGGTIYLLGGTSAVASQQETFLQGAGFTTKRLQGADRIKTGVAILNELDTLRGSNPVQIYLVNGFSFADALSVSPLAAFQEAGVMLTEQGDLSQADRDYLNAHASTISTVTLIGGTSVIPGSIATLLVSAGYNVPRLSGGDRYGTSRAIADQFIATTPPSPAGVAVASGTNFPDALGAGVHAAAQLYPLLLVPNSASKLTCSATDDYLADNNLAVTGGYLYGGTAAVGTAVEQFAEGAMSGQRAACT
ncbi:MAG: cell wall-binding repeat-containing protein [Candidatus Andersenbacteria bacterium]